MNTCPDFPFETSTTTMLSSGASMADFSTSLSWQTTLRVPVGSSIRNSMLPRLLDRSESSPATLTFFPGARFLAAETVALLLVSSLSLIMEKSRRYLSRNSFP